jgi:hypothetical protein
VRTISITPAEVQVTIGVCLAATATRAGAISESCTRANQAGRRRSDGRAEAAQREAVALIGTQLRAAFPMGAPHVTTQLFSAATRQGVPEAETMIAAWIPSPAWQNEIAEAEQEKERPRDQGE